MKRSTIALLLLTVVWGCASRTVTRSPVAAVAPALSVERFLQASNTRDLFAMARLFGTRDGPVEDTGSSFGCFWKKIGSAFGGQSCVKWADVELRMNLIAGILRHEDYRIASERSVAGAERETIRIGVDMSFARGQTVRDVGFTVVLASGDRWLIEIIELEKVTGT